MLKDDRYSLADWQFAMEQSLYGFTLNDGYFIAPFWAT